MKNKQLQETLEQKYSLGFSVDLDSDTIPIGLSENVIRTISAKKNEPDWPRKGAKGTERKGGACRSARAWMANAPQVCVPHGYSNSK